MDTVRLDGKDAHFLFIVPGRAGVMNHPEERRFSVVHRFELFCHGFTEFQSLLRILPCILGLFFCPYCNYFQTGPLPGFLIKSFSKDCIIAVAVMPVSCHDDFAQHIFYLPFRSV